MFLLSSGIGKQNPVSYTHLGDQLIFKNTDIADFNINSPSFSQDYNLRVSGGNEKGNYYAGLGYNHSDCLLYTSPPQRVAVFLIIVFP